MKYQWRVKGRSNSWQRGVRTRGFEWKGTPQAMECGSPPQVLCLRSRSIYITIINYLSFLHKFHFLVPTSTGVSVYGRDYQCVVISIVFWHILWNPCSKLLPHSLYNNYGYREGKKEIIRATNVLAYNSITFDHDDRFFNKKSIMKILWDNEYTHITRAHERKSQRITNMKNSSRE